MIEEIASMYFDRSEEELEEVANVKKELLAKMRETLLHYKILKRVERRGAEEQRYIFDNKSEVGSALERLIYALATLDIDDIMKEGEADE